jgi:hypothetical protein
MMDLVLRRCAWCERRMGWRVVLTRRWRVRVVRSHGICPPCAAEVRAEMHRLTGSASLTNGGPSSSGRRPAWWETRMPRTSFRKP